MVVGSINDLKPATLKTGVKTTPYSPTKQLADVKFVRAALIECLFDGDIAAFKEVFKAHYEAVNTSKLLKAIDLSERTFYEAVSQKGNPRLSTLAKMMKGLVIDSHP